MRLIWCIVIASVFLTGCSEPVISTHAWKVNQKERQRIFKECLSMIPKGPERTVYNDWAEVVSECGDQAFYQSREWLPLR